MSAMGLVETFCCHTLHGWLKAPEARPVAFQPAVLAACSLEDWAILNWTWMSTGSHHPNMRIEGDRSMLQNGFALFCGCQSILPWWSNVSKIGCASCLVKGLRPQNHHDGGKNQEFQPAEVNILMDWAGRECPEKVTMGCWFQLPVGSSHNIVTCFPFLS
jgi:hypothetical protein